MFDKYFLINKLVSVLKKNEFNTLTTEGCFDIVAKKEDIFLIKVLMNADSLDNDQASSLQTISHFLSAYPIVISMKNNRELLEDKIVYSRFGLSIVTPKMFEEMLEGNVSAMQSAKGRHTTEINSFSLREKRQELGYTLKQLADMIDVSKKCLYEIESKRVNPTDETVRKLEAKLYIRLRMPFEMKRSEVKYLKPKNEFQDRVSKEFIRIGVDNSAVYSAPFEIIGKEEEFPLITGLTKNSIEIRREAGFVKELSHVVSSHAVFISKKSKEKSIEGIPIVLENELPEIETSKEFGKLLLEKEE